MNDIREVMLTEPAICTPLTSIENIRKLMDEQNTQEVMVVDTILEKHLVGYIHANDIIAKANDEHIKPEQYNAELFMKPLVVTARETASEDECHRIMELNHLERLAIVDEDGHLCGVYDRQNPVRQ